MVLHHDPNPDAPETQPGLFISYLQVQTAISIPTLHCSIVVYIYGEDLEHLGTCVQL